MNNIKILVSYHKPAKLFESKTLLPIHLGRALATEKTKDGTTAQADYDWLVEHMVGDDTGDNISELNRYFCEFSAFYWAWKNYEVLGNPEYIGFCHYRRHLLFAEFFKENIKDSFEPDISEVQKYDIVCGARIVHEKNVFDQFDDLKAAPFDLERTGFDKMITLVSENKDYKKALDFYLKSHEHYWYNCFVMKKELFFEFCEFAFPVLFKVHEQLDYSNSTMNGKRVLAYLSERLFGIFMTKMTSENKKIKYKPIFFMNDTDFKKELYLPKVFDKNLCGKEKARNAIKQISLLLREFKYNLLSKFVSEKKKRKYQNQILKTQAKKMDAFLFFEK